MSIDHDGLLSRIRAAYQRMPFNRQVIATTGYPSSTWTANMIIGVAPTTSVVPTSTTLGALGQQNSSSVQRLVGTGLVAPNGYMHWIDRLAHSGGLDGTVTGEQTTNMGSWPALTRETSGVDVFAAIEIYGVIGTTGTTGSLRYTNSAGTTGRNSPLFTIGGTAYREVGRLIIVPLVIGDLGIKSVQGFTLSASTTTAGNFGVTLFKFISPVVNNSSGVTVDAGIVNPVLNMGFPPTQVVDNACLAQLWQPSVNTAQLIGGVANFGED